MGGAGRHQSPGACDRLHGRVGQVSEQELPVVRRVKPVVAWDNRCNVTEQRQHVRWKRWTSKTGFYDTKLQHLLALRLQSWRRMQGSHCELDDVLGDQNENQNGFVSLWEIKNNFVCIH